MITGVAFLKASGGGIIDRLTACIDGGQHCHVEIVTGFDGKYYDCYSCSRTHGGMRKRKNLLKSKRWAFYPCEIDVEKTKQKFHDMRNYKYDHAGLLRTKWSWFPQNDNKTTCNEFAAICLGLPSPARFGLKELERIAIRLSKN